MTFQDKNAEPGGRIKIQVDPVGIPEINLPKATPKTDPFSSVKFQRKVYYTYSLQEFNPQNKLYLTLIGQHL